MADRQDSRGQDPSHGPGRRRQIRPIRAGGDGPQGHPPARQVHPGIEVRRVLLGRRHDRVADSPGEPLGNQANARRGVGDESDLAGLRGGSIRAYSGAGAFFRRPRSASSRRRSAPGRRPTRGGPRPIVGASGPRRHGRSRPSARRPGTPGVAARPSPLWSLLGSKSGGLFVGEAQPNDPRQPGPSLSIEVRSRRSLGFPFFTTVEWKRVAMLTMPRRDVNLAHASAQLLYLAEIATCGLFAEADD